MRSRPWSYNATFCASLRGIRAAQLHPARLRLHEPAVGRSALAHSRAVVRRAPKAGRAAQPLHQARVLLARRVVADVNKLWLEKQTGTVRDVTPTPCDTSQRTDPPCWPYQAS